MKVKVCFDDECCNGYNMFVIICDIDEVCGGGWCDYGGGVVYEDIVCVFFEFVLLIKWYLILIDGLMCYIVNVVYFVGDCDYNGKCVGELYVWDDVVYFGNFLVYYDIGLKFVLFLKLWMIVDVDGVYRFVMDSGEFCVVFIVYGDSGKVGFY